MAGRPEFKPTAAQKKRVEILLGGGASQDEAALIIGIDPQTLRKHFAHELKTGKARRRGEVIEAMFKAATKGNVSAQKSYIAMGNLSPDQASPAKPLDTAELGKKAAAAVAAVNAEQGTDWAGALGDDASQQ